MDHLASLLAGESSRNLLLTLAHTLWQGALAAGVLFTCLRRTPAQAANRRYAVGIMALGATVLGALLTWSILSYRPNDARQVPNPGIVTVADVASSRPTAAAPASVPGRQAASAVKPARAPAFWQAWLLKAWMAGVAAMLLRLVVVVLGSGRLRRSCRATEEPEILAVVERLRAGMGIGRSIRVLSGPRIATPGVIGCFWPSLLLPVSMVSGIPADNLQAILVHELAHIRRYDYLVNFLQMVVEALLFFNPAVWWIGRQIRIEREACCDAAGVRWTGQRHKYAEVLVAWAQRTTAGPVPAVGFGASTDGGRLLDRVRRILLAGHQPRPRVPWHIATAMIVLSLACLVILQQATGLAVNLAGRILTPEERIDKIAGISKEYGYETREYSPEDKIEISGVVRTWDAKPLPGRTNALVRQTGRQASSIYLSVSKDGMFHTSVNPGRTYVTISAEGYAPASSGPFEAKPGSELERIELVLGDGFLGQIQTLDEGGRPIPRAELTGGYTHAESGSYIDTIKLTTDANGIATLDHAGAVTMVLDVSAEGYASERVQDLVLRPDQVKTVTLKKAQPATGVVLSQATGQPIAGAEVRIFMSVQGNSSWSRGSVGGTPDTVTDAHGRFALNRLRRDHDYLLFIRAPGHGYRYVSDVKAGRTVQVLLGEKKTIHGTVRGDLSLLATDARSGGPVISVMNSYRAGSGGHNTTGKCPVTIRDGVGSFEIDDFWGQTVTLSAGAESIRLDPQTDRLDNIVIDLRASAQRQVVLHFATPAGGPPIEGSVRIDYITDRARQQKQGMTPKWLDIQEGQATCEIPVPAQFQYGIDFRFREGKRPVGYWFNGIQPLDIPPGDAPYVIDIPVFPAGAIYGKILRPDGSPADQARAGLVIAKQPAIGNEQAISLSNLHGVLDNGVDRGTFNATPLPLGGQYAIVAHEDYAFAMSDVFSLDEKNPIVNVNLQLPQGVDVAGRLLDVDGSPARNGVSLHVSINRGEHSWGMSGAQTRPDEDGRFVFQNVNVGPQGECSVRVVGGAGYRPVTHKIEDLRSPVVIQLEKGQRVTGTVLDDVTGWPVPKVEVYAFAVDGPDGQISRSWELLEADGRTDEQGRFTFTNMAPSLYSLNVRSANLANPRAPVIVTGGQNDPVVLRILIPQWSDLKPRQP